MRREDDADGTGDRRLVFRGVTSRDLALAAAIAVALVAATAAFPALADAQGAYEIPVDRRGDPADLAEPTGSAWGSAETVEMPMTSAGAAVPQGSETAVEAARVKAVRTDERLFLRVSWSDPTANASTDGIREFADAAAVQFPAAPTDRPPLAMGSTENPVNVWYWNGAGASESLLAGGPGSTTEMNGSAVRTAATHEDGRWTVVFSRPLPSDRANVTDLTTEADTNVAFAVWEGSNGERSGRKAASEWFYLSFTDDTGAPYEILLWTVAGVAVVFTTLVTVEGIRRTRGE
ncbi:ethylbenzene dehydrogenase-related protein [Halorubrum depositum]|uniref:ethylbenzene dehydrogenase-related protein n=1 Tax=Halorubrum depositum TaxID=2583992 RepID=UPI0011A30E4C|nr:ethylbenzene dehydrogenase-related protein [Halorubrum depositum]